MARQRLLGGDLRTRIGRQRVERVTLASRAPRRQSHKRCSSMRKRNVSPPLGRRFGKAELARRLTSSVTASNRSPIGSLEMAARWTTASKPSRSPAGISRTSPKSCASKERSGSARVVVGKGEKAGVVTGAISRSQNPAQMTAQNGADIAHIAGDQNPPPAHNLPDLPGRLTERPGSSR